MKKVIFVFFGFFMLISFVNGQSVQLENSRAIISNLEKPITDLDLKVDISILKELGYKNIDELNLSGANKNTHISQIFKAHVGGKCYNFEYDQIFIIQTNKDADIKTINANPQQNLELYYSIRALEILKIRYTDLYQKLILGTINPTLQNTNLPNYLNWYNRFPKIVISFNEGTNDIAISGTYLDQNPTSFDVNGHNFQLYENFPVISIQTDLIKGKNQNAGSYPVYKKPTAQENYLLYLKEGLLHSICHELIHRYIDIHNNKKGTIYNYLAFGNGRKNTNDPQYNYQWYNMEEIILNRTLDNYFRKYGGISPVLLDYYLKVETSLINGISDLKVYKETLMKLQGINDDLSLDW